MRLVARLAILGIMLMLGGCRGTQTRPAVAAAGFRSFWTTDPARSYRTAFDDGKTYGATSRSRPVLVNIWYPAASGGPPMAHADYLRIEPHDAALKPLAERLVIYEREVLVAELVAGDKSAEARDCLDRFLARPTSVVRDAAPAGGRYPLVIYHAGAGSTFEDNSALCESLAHAGFVVIGGAFQAADGSSFNVDVENAGREFEFLLRLASGMDNIDVARVGIVGHSAGAHAALVYGARPGIGVAAIVALDTTQDYRTLADPRWSTLVPAVTRGRDLYCTSTLLVAGPSAIFSLADTLAGAERVYLTVPGVSHNEYISQGELAAEIAAVRKPDPRLTEHARKTAETGRSLRAAVTAYLRAKLKNDEQAWAEILALRENPLGSAMHVDLMPVGAAEVPEAPQTPTPRSVYRALRRGGGDGAVAELSRSETLDPRFFDESFALPLLYDLAVSDRPLEAARLARFFATRGIDVRPMLVSQTEFFASLKRYDNYVEGCVRLGRAIGTGDPAIDAMVDKYGKPQQQNQ